MKKTIDDAASQGGKARAQSMSPEARKESARSAALARWEKASINSIFPRETHGGVLRIGELEIPCGVLSNGLRVLSTRGVSRAMGSTRTGTKGDSDGAPQLPNFLASDGVKPFISAELLARLQAPVIYHPKHGGRTAYGYEARILPDVCEVILDAKVAGTLKESQGKLADAALILIRALAKVGIIALVDEATGYQADRARDELQLILESYVVEEMRPWISVFPNEFFKQIYRLHGWAFKEGNFKRPQYVGKLINEWIYGRLPKPVLPELRHRNPAVEGRRRHKHHQFLTEDTGIPHLDKQISSVTTLMRASRDKKMFEALLTNAFPLEGEQMHLVVGVS